MRRDVGERQLARQRPLAEEEPLRAARQGVRRIEDGRDRPLVVDARAAREQSPGGGGTADEQSAAGNQPTQGDSSRSKANWPVIIERISLKNPATNTWNTCTRMNASSSMAAMK